MTFLFDEDLCELCNARGATCLVDVDDVETWVCGYCAGILWMEWARVAPHGA